MSLKETVLRENKWIVLEIQGLLTLFGVCLESNVFQFEENFYKQFSPQIKETEQ